LFHKGWFQGENLFPWPTLPEIVRFSPTSALTRWNHLLCFPLNRKPNKLITDLQ
jgi:hypothetical protein